MDTLRRSPSDRAPETPSQSDNTSGFAADVTVSDPRSSSLSAASTISPGAVDACANIFLDALSPALADHDNAIITDMAVDQVPAKTKPARTAPGGTA
jgi:hypothetical protein